MRRTSRIVLFLLLIFGIALSDTVRIEQIALTECKIQVVQFFQFEDDLLRSIYLVPNNATDYQFVAYTGNITMRDNRQTLDIVGANNLTIKYTVALQVRAMVHQLMYSRAVCFAIRYSLCSQLSQIDVEQILAPNTQQISTLVTSRAATVTKHNQTRITMVLQEQWPAERQFRIITAFAVNTISQQCSASFQNSDTLLVIILVLVTVIQASVATGCACILGFVCIFVRCCIDKWENTYFEKQERFAMAIHDDYALLSYYAQQKMYGKQMQQVRLRQCQKFMDLIVVVEG